MLNELFILTKIKEGDIKAFEEIFRRYYSPLCWYAAGITGEMEAAEEIVEELFYVFWKDREHLQIFQSGNCQFQSMKLLVSRHETMSFKQ